MNLSFKDTVELFDELLEFNAVGEVIAHIERENAKQIGSIIRNEEKVPNTCHFIWLGSFQEESLDYLRIWKNLDTDFTLWIDSNTKYSTLVKPIIEDIQSRFDLNVIRSQDVFYKFARAQGADNLDIAVSCYVERYLPHLLTVLYEESVNYQTRISELSGIIEIKDLANFEGLFIDHSYLEFYLYETVLRTNFAAASDIIRLCLLWHLGGVYLDVDTLPCIGVDYSEIKSKYDIPPSITNLFDVYISYQLLLKNGASHSENGKIKHCKSLIMSTHSNLIDELNVIVEQQAKFQKFIYPEVNSQLIAISCSKNNYEEFNNNLVACHPKSKAVQIILREMKRRYNYCERNGIIFLNKQRLSAQTNSYYSRLSNYRYDGFAEDDEVTLILSGPSMILEVLLGSAYKLAKLKENISPESISYALRVHKFGLSYDKQTMFTLKHITSSWMVQ